MDRGPTPMALLLAAGLVLGGCGDADEEGPPLAPGGPVASVDPEADATGVLVTAAVRARFLEPLDPASVDAGTFTLERRDTGEPVAGSASYDEFADTATFRPAADLAPGTTFTATLTDGIRLAAVRPFPGPMTWSFTTAPEQVRLSAAPDGTQGDAASFAPSLDRDGGRAAFVSRATNLAPDNRPNAPDVYLKDSRTGEVTLVSAGADGGPANGASYAPALSADGRWVAFVSAADNLLPDGEDGNGVADIFLADTQTGGLRRVNTTAEGEAARAAASAAPAVSADGAFVAFQSGAANLGEDDAGVVDVFRKDTRSGELALVSTGNDGVGDNHSTAPVLSADGRYVAFRSRAANLVPGDTNGVADIFRKDMETGEVVRVSVAESGAEAGDASGQPAISPSGRFVAFLSRAANLVPDDTNGVVDVFLRDLKAGTTERVNLAADGGQANGTSLPANADEAARYQPAVAAGGRYVAFVSLADNLVREDGNGLADVFIKDRDTGAIRWVGGSDGGSRAPTLSADGRYLGLETTATDLLAPDTNAAADVVRVLNGLTRP